MHRREPLADDAGQIGDERCAARCRSRYSRIEMASSSRTIRSSKPNRPNSGRADRTGDRVDIRPALGKVGVNEIAEDRQDRADQHGRQAAEPSEQIAAQAMPSIVMKMPNTFDAKATSSFE